MLTSIVRFWIALKSWRWRRVNGTFSRTMTPNTHLGRPHNGLKTMISKLYHDQHSLQSLIPLNTFGNISNDNFASTKLHPKEHMNCGTDWLMSGIEFHQRYVKA